VPANVGGQPVVLDAGGRVTSLRGTTFSWAEDGTLHEADDPPPAVAETYGIDARGRRFRRQLAGSPVEYYAYEGLDRIAIVGPNVGSSAGPVLESYLFDGVDHPLRIARPGVGTTNYFYYEVDLAGNVRGLRASGGASLGGYRYTAFGKTLEDTSLITQPLRWKARWFSPVAGGTYDVRARQWSPELGIFLEIDEFEFHGPTTTLWGWPGMNPITWADSRGRGKSGGGGSSDDWGDAPPGGPPPSLPGPKPCDKDGYDKCVKGCESAYENDSG
jgi:RHS repeat-associated protein